MNTAPITTEQSALLSGKRFFLLDCETPDEEYERTCFFVVSIAGQNIVFEAQSTRCSESGEKYPDQWLNMEMGVEEYRAMYLAEPVTFVKASVYSKEDWLEMGFGYHS